MRRDAGLIFPTPRADHHSVEPARHQLTEHTLILSLVHRLVLLEDVVVFDGHMVVVEVSSGVAPVHLQTVVTSHVCGCRVQRGGRFCSRIM